MELFQIQQYSHKIEKIIITNENTKSNYKYVTIKIHLDRDTNETIRFSLTKNPTAKEWLSHQSFDNDFFLRIPNITPSVTEVYAHFFPSNLYDYTESEEICSIYDFSDLAKDNAYNQWDGMQYPIQIQSNGYDMVIGNDNKPLIRSILNNSISQYKDPNYKNYTITSNPIDATEKGRFPLSSRYRNSLYNQAPDITGKTTSLPYWQSGRQNKTNGDDCEKRNKKVPFWEAKIYRTGLSPLIDHGSDDSDNPINVYLNYQYLPTSTEYHQHYFGFEESNLKKQNGDPVTDDIPTAIESYVPYKNGVKYNATASRQLREQLNTYCQNIKNGVYQQITPNNSYEVLDGEGLMDVFQNFTVKDEEDKIKETTYRLIRHGDPYQATSTMYIDHKNIYDVNLDKITITNNCLWDKNQCQKYWTYTPTGEGNAYINISLKANTYYVLKYFMYIPADAYIEDDSCYMEVQSYVADDVTTIGSLPQAFKDQDKNLKHQWIYHEIPFYTLETNNRIVIKGPQHNHEGIIGINKLTKQVITNPTEQQLDDPNIEEHDCKNDLIHFYSIQIAEMVEYSPVLKYTKTGLYLSEGNKYAKKSLEDMNDTSCAPDIGGIYQWQDTLHPTGTWIDKGHTELPIPTTDIYILFGDDFDILYNEITTELSYTKGDYAFIFDNFNEAFDETLSWVTNDELIKLEYDRITTPYNEALLNQESTNQDDDDEDVNELLKAELRLFNKQHKVFTTGMNNEFELMIQDAYGNPITIGQVECSIWKNNKENDTLCSSSEKCLGIREPDEQGTIKFTRLNFKNFQADNTYYLRVVYTHPCYKKKIIKWKKIYFIEERRNIYVYANKCNNAVCHSATTCCEEVGTSIYNNNDKKYINNANVYIIKHVEEFPLRLDVKIKDQLGIIKNEGYCELSVNDKIVQTTFVDDNAIADFYLDECDLDGGTQTIKIEYYINPNNAVNFVYFYINCDEQQGYDERPAIPIRINKITNETVTQLTTQIYEIAKDDIFFVDIDTEDSKNFSITIQRNDEKEEIINVLEEPLENHVIAAMYDTNSHTAGDKDKYTITTGNLKNLNDGTDVNSLYRTSKKEFTLIWK